jgi:hypothetical protein
MQYCILCRIDVFIIILTIWREYRSQYTKISKYWVYQIQVSNERSNLNIKIAKPCDELEMTCKGICIRHKAQKPIGTGRYSTGQKRCQICETFLKWDGLYCPCCGCKLRTVPRNLKYKARLRTGEYQLTLQQRQKLHQQR